MNTYFLLSNYSDQGIRNVRESPRRVDAARELIRSVGGEMKPFYLTMGKFDFIAHCEFPDDAAAARFALSLGALGNVRTTTVKAFPESEFRDIIGSLP